MKTYILVASNTEWKMLQKFSAEHPDKVAGVAMMRIGIGKSNTYLSLVKIARAERNLSEVRFINIGLCGCSVKGAQLYDIVEPVNFLDGDRDNTCEFTRDDLYPEDTGHEGPVLSSASQFVTEPKIEAYFDMEGFCINAFCREFGLGLKSYKLVSDHCSIKSCDGIDFDRMYTQFEKALLSCSWL